MFEDVWRSLQKSRSSLIPTPFTLLSYFYMVLHLQQYFEFWFEISMKFHLFKQEYQEI